MEELLELKALLTGGNISEALLLVEEMTEMSKDDKLNKIFSFSIILLLHLIKQQAEKRTTRSWEVSIRNSVRQIQRSNKRRKASGNYTKHGHRLRILKIRDNTIKIEKLVKRLRND
jgi:hypothetical protein